MSSHAYCEKCGTWIYVGYDDAILCESCRTDQEEEEEENKTGSEEL